MSLWFVFCLLTSCGFSQDDSQPPLSGTLWSRHYYSPMKAVSLFSGEVAQSNNNSTDSSNNDTIHVYLAFCRNGTFHEELYINTPRSLTDSLATFCQNSSAAIWSINSTDSVFIQDDVEKKLIKGTYLRDNDSLQIDANAISKEGVLLGKSIISGWYEFEGNIK